MDGSIVISHGEEEGGVVEYIVSWYRVSDKEVVNGSCALAAPCRRRRLTLIRSMFFRSARSFFIHG